MPASICTPWLLPGRHCKARGSDMPPSACSAQSCMGPAAPVSLSHLEFGPWEKSSRMVPLTQTCLSFPCWLFQCHPTHVCAWVLRTGASLTIFVSKFSFIPTEYTGNRYLPYCCVTGFKCTWAQCLPWKMLNKFTVFFLNIVDYKIRICLLWEIWEKSRNIWNPISQRYILLIFCCISSLSFLSAF